MDIKGFLWNVTIHCIITFPAKTEIQRVFCILPDKTKMREHCLKLHETFQIFFSNFCENIYKFRDVRSFFSKLKMKFRRLEKHLKHSYVFGKLDESTLALKKLGYRFLLTMFFH